MSWVDDHNAALLTDFYELTMAASYHRRSMDGGATFDLFVRSLPDKRNFLVACGLEQALDYLEKLHFTPESIDYLASLDLFDDDFLAYLSELRFTGEVWAMAEGEIAFHTEPLLRVTAPLIEAQIVETFLLNNVLFQTMVASKAARLQIASGERAFVDFSPRRDHGADAALKAARASYVGGAVATSNVLAGKLYGIPLSGTMAHSYIMAFEDEEKAFRSFLEDFPDRAVLLIDTFDVEEGARRAVRVARALGEKGIRLRGVRIDSGDLGHLAVSVRKILDEAGMNDTEIVLSGDLDEERVKRLIDEDVPVDAFGIGTQLGTSGDAPSLGGVYKLVADAAGPKMKLSAGKATIPGCKQVFRIEENGVYVRDLLAVDNERVGGRPLLHKVMEDGARTTEPEPLEDIRTRCQTSLSHLSHDLRSLSRKVDYPVEPSPRLAELFDQLKARWGRAE